MTVPLRPSDPRPGGKPFYIPNRCASCDGPLVLDEKSARSGWLDEFRCPKCKGGTYMDVPEEYANRILNRVYGYRARGKVKP